MSKEEKQILLVDLCGRLPYQPIVYIDENLPRLKLGAATRVWEYVAVDKPCKPYLRPMDSMTDEEKKELGTISCEYDELHKYAIFYKSQDWLNKNMFDYRGLIPMGLALEAPEGMYGKETGK